MAVNIKRDGFGQVEPNHLSAPRDGRVYAQLPASEDDFPEMLQQGMFVKYDYAEGECNLSGDGEWMLVFNEEKLYDERKQMHKDFAQQRSEAVDGVIVPRVFGTVVGDIYTTNMVAESSYTVGDKLTPDAATGILAKGEGTPTFQVVKETTLPDMQPAVKLQRIA